MNEPIRLADSRAEVRSGGVADNMDSVPSRHSGFAATHCAPSVGHLAKGPRFESCEEWNCAELISAVRVTNPLETVVCG